MYVPYHLKKEGHNLKFRMQQPASFKKEISFGPSATGRKLLFGTEESFWVGINFFATGRGFSSLLFSLSRKTKHVVVGTCCWFWILLLASSDIVARSHTPFPPRSTLCSSHRSLVFIQCGSASNKSSRI